jgi:hypothetical protein
MANTQNKLQERDPFLWGMIALIVGTTALFLWRWYVS